MIKEIDISSESTAQQVLEIQTSAYKIEAEIIGSYKIPPLRDTVNTLQKSEETFFGWYLEKELTGVISVKTESDTIDIHRLIVHPIHFRKGIAQKMLHHMETNIPCKILLAATASKNTPAINFYMKNGFKIVKLEETDELISITHFKKKL